MKLSYGVCVCNEFVEIQFLLPYLIKNKREEDEIVILFDSENGDPCIEEYLRVNSVINPKFRWYPYKFQGNFSDLKNCLTSLCTGEYIINIDSDEIPNEYLMKNLPELLEHNPEVDMYWVSRENYVIGITPEHIKTWGWRVDEQNRINWPDMQMRIFKSNKNICWVNKVHEVLDGYNSFAYLPSESRWGLNHTKSIEKQEKQNNYYNTL